LVLGLKLRRREQGGAAVAQEVSPALTNGVKGFVKDSAQDFEDAMLEEDAAGRAPGHGPRGVKAVTRVAELMRMTGWKVLSLNSRYGSGLVDIIARKGGSTYMAQCVFGSSRVVPDLMESYISQYRDIRRAAKATGLMVIFPRAEVAERDRTIVMLRNKGDRVEFFGEQNWVDEVSRPATRRGSTSNTELTLMWAVTAVGAVAVLFGLSVGLNFLLLAAGYVVYIFGVVGVVVGTIFKYRDL
jgi:hypothetical protein